MSGFQQKLAQGKAGESQIANWLKARGHHILPIYEKVDNDYKGPTVFSSNGDAVIAPDLLAFGKGKTIWVEAKHKNAFTWHRNTKRFVTGIDIHHYEQYIKVSMMVDWPVWLLFLHRGGQAINSPESPSGLYGECIEKLISKENHRHKNHGKTGMVYWSIDSLILLSAYPLEN